MTKLEMLQQKNTFIMQRSAISYWFYTIWLFTRSDLKTIVGPSTAYGLVNLLSGSTLTSSPRPSISEALIRIPIVSFWVWINLLPFSIDNQRHPLSIKEDRENKKWRPLPSERLKPEQATKLMIILYMMAFLTSLLCGSIWQCIGLMCLGYWYNDLEGADSHWFIRSFINACGYICFISGAAQVAVNQSNISLQPVAYKWLLILGTVILTTVHAQDIHDQAGDSLRRRWTVPLVFGDLAARWCVCLSLMIWSYFCPAFWKSGMVGFTIPMCLAITVSLRYLSLRDVLSDKKTFRIYNLWIISLYILPLLSQIKDT